jgi:hypothetical protein
MNKRIKKKKVKCILNNVQKYGLKDNEFLVFKYDIKKFKSAEIQKCAEQLREIVSDKILFVPTDFQGNIILK